MLKLILDTMEEALGTRFELVASPTMMMNLLGLCFHMDDTKDLYSRVQPLILGHNNAYLHKELTERSESYDALASGGTANSIQDA